MSKNADGLLSIMALLVVVVIGLIGGVGYYVFGAKSGADNKQITIQNSIENTEEQPVSEVSNGYKQYGDDNLSFQYPESWTATKNASQPEWIFFTSPDYLAQDVGPSTVIQAGYLLEIKVTHIGTNVAFEQSIKNARANQDNGDGEIIQIDGHDSLLSNAGSDSAAGTILVATAFVNGKTYYFRLSGAANAGSETRQLFDSLLASVRIEQEL